MTTHSGKTVKLAESENYRKELTEMSVIYQQELKAAHDKNAELLKQIDSLEATIRKLSGQLSEVYKGGSNE